MSGYVCVAQESKAVLLIQILFKQIHFRVSCHYIWVRNASPRNRFNRGDFRRRVHVPRIPGGDTEESCVPLRRKRVKRVHHLQRKMTHRSTETSKYCIRHTKFGILPCSAFLSLATARLFSHFLLRGTQTACRYTNAHPRLGRYPWHVCSTAKVAGTGSISRGCVPRRQSLANQC